MPLRLRSSMSNLRVIVSTFTNLQRNFGASLPRCQQLAKLLAKISMPDSVPPKAGVWRQRLPAAAAALCLLLSQGPAPPPPRWRVSSEAFSGPLGPVPPTAGCVFFFALRSRLVFVSGKISFFGNRLRSRYTVKS